MKIVLIEDDHVDRIAITMALKKHDIEAYSDPNDVKSYDCDLLITDLILYGGITGIDVVNNFREQRPGQDAIIYTALAKGQHYRDAMAVARVVEKKSSLDNLVNAVEFYGK